MSIRIIAIGKEHESYIKTGLELFTKRLRPHTNVEWVLLPYAGGDEVRSRRGESRLILDKIDERDLVVLLDERGTEWDSPGFAAQLDRWQGSGKRIVFVIGGAYGVSEELSKRSDFSWSLSALVFPHQLVRLLLLEQLYRGYAILAGSPYHHR